MRISSLGFTLSLAAVAALAGCSSNVNPVVKVIPASIPVPSSVTAVSGYTVSVFSGPAQAGTSTHPDSIIQLGSNIFVGYGDSVNPDGTTPGSNPPVQGHCEMIEYDLKGNPVKTFTLPGHNDGLLAFDSHTIWALSNEDASPVLTIIDLTASTQTEFTPTMPLLHGGGLDDLALINGKVFVSASNPNVNASNQVSNAPALISIALNANGTTFDWAPVLSGTAIVSSMADGSAVTLNLTDPDSESIDSHGNLVLDSQGDSELVFITNPGTSTQVAKVLPLSLYSNPWPVDDTRFVPSALTIPPYLLFTDSPSNTIYRLDTTFTPADSYSAGGGTILKLNTSTGALTPVVTGLGSPHGMLFPNQ
jgi:hypothetical protein